MNYNSKQSLFQNFLNQWGDQFKQIPHILDYILAHTEIKKHFGDLNFISKDAVYSSQRDWISLVSQLKHPLEKEFFQAHWVPIQKDKLDCFIDLSSGTFSIFQVFFFTMEPYAWYKQYFFHDISNLFLAAEDSSIWLELELEENEIDACNDWGDLQEKCEKLSFSGKIKPPLVQKVKIFDLDNSVKNSLLGNKLTISGVTPFVVSFLPYSLPIYLTNYTGELGNITTEFQKNVNSIQKFIFLLHFELFAAISFEFLFVPSELGSVKFRNNTIEIMHSDKSILHHIRQIFQ